MIEFRGMRSQAGIPFAVQSEHLGKAVNSARIRISGAALAHFPGRPCRKFRQGRADLEGGSRHWRSSRLATVI